MLNQFNSCFAKLRYLWGRSRGVHNKSLLLCVTELRSGFLLAGPAESGKFWELSGFPKSSHWIWNERNGEHSNRLPNDHKATLSRKILLKWKIDFELVLFSVIARTYSLLLDFQQCSNAQNSPDSFGIILCRSVYRSKTAQLRSGFWRSLDSLLESLYYGFTLLKASGNVKSENKVAR